MKNSNKSKINDNQTRIAKDEHDEKLALRAIALGLVIVLVIGLVSSVIMGVA